MPILAIAGVSLPVLIDSLSVSFERVGDVGRNASGWRVGQRRREKSVIEFTLAPKPIDETMMYRSLLLGDGEYWDTASGPYGSKAMQLTGSGAWTATGGGNPQTTNGVFRCSATQTMVVPWRIYDQSIVSAIPTSGVFGGSLVGWRRDDAAGTYRVFGWSWRTLDTTATVKREALGTSGGLGTLGTPQAYTGNETFAVSTTALTVTAGAGGPFSYSNMMLLPWYFKAAQLDALITGRNLIFGALPRLPRLHVTSDLFPPDNIKSPIGNNEGALICEGEVTSLAITPLMTGGLFDKTAGSISGRLIEV